MPATPTLAPDEVGEPTAPLLIASACMGGQRWHRVRRRRAVSVLIGLSIVLVATVLLATGSGAVKISPAQVLCILLQPLGIHLSVAYEPQQAGVFWLLRLPRVALALLVGGGLGLCGVSMQGIFRNPLADPALTGVSSGAAFGVVTTIVFAGKLGFHTPSWWVYPLCGFVGGILATAVVNALGRTDGATRVAGLLLAGIAINAFCGAGVGLATFVANDAQLRSIAFWTLGSLGGANWPVCALLAPLTLICGWLMLRQSRVLNALLLGELEAGHLGFRVETCKRLLLICTALLAGAFTSVVGVIGFIGLVVPHLARLVLGPDHRLLMPVSLLLGAILLLVADTLCRTIAAPAEIPVGVATALIGAPFFLWLLRHDRRAL